MAKQVSVSSDEGFASTASIGSDTVSIDPTGETAPDTIEHLLGTYAACYVPALRVGAEQRNVGDLGSITIDVSGALNDDDKLDGIEFDVTVDTALEDDEIASVVERANELCKVHDALKTSLYATVTVNGHQV